MKILYLAFMALTALASCSNADDATTADDYGEDAQTGQYAPPQSNAGANQYAQNQPAQMAPQQQLAQANQPAPQAMQMPAGSVRVQPAQIIDPSGFGQPMVAADKACH